MALTLVKEGHFEWEDFHQQLIRSIGEWEQLECGAQPPWDYYERFFEALKRMLKQHRLASQCKMDHVMAPYPASPYSGGTAR